MSGVGAKCHIVCVGDSLTAGGCVDDYPRKLKAMLTQKNPKCNWSTTKLGMCGASAADWLNYHISNASNKASFPSADVFLIMLGTNDCQLSKSFDETTFSNNLKQIVQLLSSEAPGASVCLATPPPVLPGGSFARDFDHVLVNSKLPTLIPQIAESLGVKCVDCFSAFGGAAPNRNGFNPDGVHLEAEGNTLIASAMVNAVIQCADGMSERLSQPGPTVGRSADVQPTSASEVYAALGWAQKARSANFQLPAPSKIGGPKLCQGYQVNDGISASQAYGAIAEQKTSFPLLTSGTIEPQYQYQTPVRALTAQNASSRLPTSSTIEAQKLCQSYQVKDGTSGSQAYAARAAPVSALTAQNASSRLPTSRFYV